MHTTQGSKDMGGAHAQSPTYAEDEPFAELSSASAAASSRCRFLAAFWALLGARWALLGAF